MSLFQICYGPEIESIFNVIKKYPGISISGLVEKFQYSDQGDISSLVDAVLNFLINLNFIKIDENKKIYPTNKHISKLNIIKRLSEIARETNDPSNPNYVFSSIYYQIFVTQNQLFVKDLYYQTNLEFEKCLVSQEKINAWKRMMQFFGLGYRVYGGFYALPHNELMTEMLKENENWEGPIQIFLENHIDPYIPCIYNGNAYLGVVFSLLNLGNNGYISLSKKQDLPYHSYGEKKEWNWMRIGGIAG